MRRNWKTVLLTMLAVTLVTGCSLTAGAASGSYAVSSDTGLTTTTATIPSNNSDTQPPSTETPAAPATIIVRRADGVISDGEYTNDGTAGPLSVYWYSDGTSLYVGLQAETSGWLAIGFSPDRTHQGANIIIGAVADGKLNLLDSYGTSERGTFHTEDVALGGVTNILASAGTNAGGITTIEFQIPLNSGDSFDSVLTPGETVDIILVVGSTSNLTSMHTFATFATLSI